MLKQKLIKKFSIVVSIIMFISLFLIYDNNDNLFVRKCRASSSSGVNVALQSNGATATASSSHSSGNFPASSAIDGDRTGSTWGNAGGWNDDTSSTWSDWLQVEFNYSYTIDEIDVITLQDSNRTEPTEQMTFSLYGITDFDVQYWSGSSWVTITGGSVTNNNKVWKKFTFSPVTTSKIRVLIHGSADTYYSRIVEVEAWTADVGINVALQSNGATATASSSYSSGEFPASTAIDGDRTGSRWGNAGGWNDGTSSTWSDWLQVEFNYSYSIGEIDVITLQDSNRTEPTEQMTFSLYGITDFDVQYWSGSSWVTITGGSVTNNNKVWRKFVFTPVTTNKIRVLIHGSADTYYSRVIAVEAWIVPVNTYKYDVGNGTVETGYTSVTASTAYLESLGYGWASTTGLGQLSRTGPDNLRKDYVYEADPFTFKSDLPHNGKWFVSVITGDNDANQGTFDIFVEGVWSGCVFNTLSSGTFKDITVGGVVNDGQINIEFKPKGGANARICAIVISDGELESTTPSVDPVPSATPYFDAIINDSYGGDWVELSDVDNDGDCEFISCRMMSGSDGYGLDYHGITAVVAQEMDGTVKWTWGTANSGNRTRNSDLGMQIYDWDEDGTKEVLILAKASSSAPAYLKVLNASTGAEERSLSLPSGTATDQLIICNLSNGAKKDIIIKDRYRSLWAYDYNWNQLWYRSFSAVAEDNTATGHYPLAIDITGDGRDEVIIGNWCLNYDGTTRWTLNPLVGDHCDNVTLYTDGNGVPQNYRFILSFGWDGIYMIDGNGSIIWNRMSRYPNGDDRWPDQKWGHIQKTVSADILPQYSGKEILEFAAYLYPMNKFDITNPVDGSLIPSQSLSTSPIEWNNDSVYELIMHEGVVSAFGAMMKAFSLPSGYTKTTGLGTSKGRYGDDKYYDVDGDQRQDMVYICKDSSNNYRLVVFTNTSGMVISGCNLGTGLNFSLY